ncbi:MAG TPA: BON domain-containing protein [Pyrinomonadaceae bacterium]|nr:BON domain-containing protein [Pyrinomonadaceae bacterium]
MSYDEQEAHRSRVVVETPHTRREVTHTESVRGEREGVSGATVGVIVVVAVALVTILILFLMSGQTDTANDNLALQQQPVQPSTTIVQQPAAQQPPVIIQQAPPATQQAPIIVTQPSGGTSSSGSEDLAIQAEVDKRILDDPNLSTLGVTVSVLSGKATLIGTVKSESIKAQFERLVRAVRGVKEIDNQITVSG